MYPNIVNNASLFTHGTAHGNPLDAIELAYVPPINFDHIVLTSYNAIADNANVNVVLASKALLNLRLGDIYHAAVVGAFLATIMITTKFVKTQTAAFCKNANELRKKKIAALMARVEEQRATATAATDEPKKTVPAKKQKQKKPVYKQQQLNITNTFVPRCPKRGNRRRIFDTLVLPNTKTADVLNAIIAGVIASRGALAITKYSPATSSFEFQTTDNAVLACKFAINVYSNSATVNTSGRQKTHNHIVELRRLNGNLTNCYHATEPIYPALNILIDATQNTSQINTRSNADANK